MKLDVVREDTISNLSTSKKFTIEASSKAFQVLSSNLYERKIEAIVRELSCNAFDSHFEAGKPEVPFKVHLPTAFENHFSVQDFGVGLNEQEVEEIYTTYFKSTKTGTNDLIGGLGLGSKTPFSYTDSFVVTAIKDGVQRVFNCSIGSGGEPEVSKMFELPTSECNGVEVKVGVSEKDIWEFRKAANKVYSWFDVKPECNRELELEVEEDVLKDLESYGYSLKTRGGKHSYNLRCKVVMGQVCYDLNIDDLTGQMNQDSKDFIETLKKADSTLHIQMNIGDADVNAGREKLSLDDRTKKNLITKIEEILVNLSTVVEDKMKGFSNIVEAYNTLNIVERQIGKDLPVNGHCITNLLNPGVINPHDSGKFPILWIASECFYATKSSNRYGRDRNISYSSIKTKELVNIGKIKVVINDCELKSGLIRAVKLENSLGSPVYVVADKQTKLTPELSKELDKLFFGAYEIVYASSFWNGSKAARKTTSVKLKEETVKCSYVTPLGVYENQHLDFTTKDKSKWAYFESSRSHGEFLELFGESFTILRHDFRDILPTLGLDGVAICNGNNKNKIKRILSTNIASLIEAKYNRKDVERLAYNNNCYEVRTALSDKSLTVLDSFVKFKQNLEQPVVNEAIAVLFLQTSTGLKIKRRASLTLMSRIQVFEKTRDLLCSKSEILDCILTPNMSDELVDECKKYIEFLNRKEK